MAENSVVENSAVENTVIENAVIEKFLVFSVQEKRYALSAKIISEVTILEKVFPLPLVPDYVRGIINRYSVPYALIDLNFLLLNESSTVRKVIVLKEEVDKLAFLIDDVTDIADLPADQLMKIDQEETALISAFFEWKDNHVLCLDTGELISKIKRDFGQ
jgi:purine-binding chemotaxis protein CheW